MQLVLDPPMPTDITQHGFGVPASYRSVAKAGYEHEAIITGGGKNVGQTFPWLHTFIGIMKRMILGTYHSVAPKYLDDYISAYK